MSVRNFVYSKDLERSFGQYSVTNCRCDVSAFDLRKSMSTFEDRRSMSRCVDLRRRCVGEGEGGQGEGEGEGEGGTGGGGEWLPLNCIALIHPSQLSCLCGSVGKGSVS